MSQTDVHPTHTQLVERAARWLRNSIGCRVVLSELRAATKCYETPDAIGWVRGKSALVECKTSRADFRADLRKPMRNPMFKSVKGMGHWRFYMTRPDLLDPRELPEGWGLYEVHEHNVRYAGGFRYASTERAQFESDRASEVAMLVSALARKEA